MICDVFVFPSPGLWHNRIHQIKDQMFRIQVQPPHLLHQILLQLLLPLLINGSLWILLRSSHICFRFLSKFTFRFSFTS